MNWASYVSETHLARVLFISESSFAEPVLMAALRRPEKLDVAWLRDASLESVRALLERRLGKGAASSELTDQQLEIVGGRYSDVASLVARLKEGASPSEAIESLVSAASVTVRLRLASASSGKQWTRPQLWRTMRVLAETGPDGCVPYDVFLWRVLRGDEVTLKAMQQFNIVKLTSRANISSDAKMGFSGDNTGKVFVQSGSPLYAEVYRRLVNTEGFAAILDLEVAKDDIARSQSSLNDFEKQLAQIQEIDNVYYDKGRHLNDPNKTLVARKVQLLGLIQESYEKLEKAHNARRQAVKILKKCQQEYSLFVASALE